MKKEVIKNATDKIVDAISIIAKEALSDLLVEDEDKDKKGD